MTLSERIDVLVDLADYLSGRDERLGAYLHRTKQHHKWFTADNLDAALELTIQQQMRREVLEQLAERDVLAAPTSPAKIGIIQQEEVPLAAWADMMAVFLAGHRAVVKLQEDSPYLLPFLVKKMGELYPATSSYFAFPKHLPLSTCQGVVATVAADRRPILEQYCKNIPHRIRPIRKAVALITGEETPADFRLLARDVFTFFGKGSRNVSKLFVPQGYDFNTLLEVFHEQKDIIRHTFYKNNYDYQISMLILDKKSYWNNGSIIVTENNDLHSPVGVLHFEHYTENAPASTTQSPDIQHWVMKSIDNPQQQRIFGESLYHPLSDWEWDFFHQL